MDFTLTDEQQAISDLTARILGDRITTDALRQIEAGDDWFAADAWAELARADLLGIALPEPDGGGGYGIVEACLIAEQIGRRVAPLPYLHCVAGAAMAIAEHGSDEQRAALLPGVIDGSSVLTVALHEPDAATVPEVPGTVAQRIAGRWRIDGHKIVVSWADRAEVILVPARTGERAAGAFLVRPGDAGVDLRRGTAVTGEPQWAVDLDGVEVDDAWVLGEPDGGAEVVAGTCDRLAAAICATQTGVCEEALALTAAHVSTREQFGAKLGTFQAVAQRAADAYIDTEAVRLTALAAAWRLGAGLPAADELLVAKFWAAEGAQRVVHAAQHLHGGVGVDTDHPVHRYFRWAKVLELSLGGASTSLVRLGANLAADPVGA